LSGVFFSFDFDRVHSAEKVARGVILRIPLNFSLGASLLGKENKQQNRCEVFEGVR
jgi:hypothetical protein